MSFAIQHVHVKTQDPQKTMQFYIDNLGATYVAEIPGRGHRVNLHGLTLNITTLISSQNHEQHYGIEHIALDTDDYSGAMAKLRDNGVRVLGAGAQQRPAGLLPRGPRRRANRIDRESRPALGFRTTTVRASRRALRAPSA